MITEYVLYLLIIPILILWKLIFVDRSNEQQLLNKDDTIALRGMSAFFVMAAHYMGWVDGLVEYTTNTVVKGAIGQLGGIGVLIFFFVSGYGLYESYRYKEIDKFYLVKRLKGVYFPYIIIKIIFLIIYHILGLSSGNIGSELINILLVEDWFIHVIVIQYIIFFIAAKINKKYMIVICIAADCILTFMYFYQNKPIRWFNALWLFTFGIVVSKYQKHITKVIKKYYYYMLTISIIGFVLMGSLFALNKGFTWANVFKPISGMFLCICMCIIMRKCKLNSPINIWAGKRSMHLYIVHITMWNYLVRINNPIERLWIALIITIVITELTYRITTYVSEKIFCSLLFRCTAL